MDSTLYSEQSNIINNLELSIVIPVYNLAKEVTPALDRIISTIETISNSFEIIVVDDGSKDATLQVLQEKHAMDRRIKLISYFPNMGKGHAVRKGVLESQGKIILFIDGDLDISPEVIGSYLSKLSECDLVIASKRHPHSKVEAPISRRFLSKVFNIIVRALTGTKFRDTQAGMKVGNGDILRAIFSVMTIRRYAFDVELLAVIAAVNGIVKEMPVEITINRRFKIAEAIRMFVDVIFISYKLHISKSYHKQLANREFRDYKQINNLLES